MINDSAEKLKKVLGTGLLENIALSNYTTMKVGGPAKYFYQANKIDDLVNAVLAAQEDKIPYLILGGGSNVIASEAGFDGLVILNRANNIAFLSESAQVIIDSGASLMRLIVESANRDIGGLESLYGIPGTLGGAVYGNAGAQGVEICDLIRGITLLSADGKIVRYTKDWLEAGYRTTKLKELRRLNKETSVILSIKIQLTHSKKEEILRKIQNFKKLREEKQPYDKPSAGSIFKNIGKEKEKTAGFILEEIGAKKLKNGGAEVSKKHANFVINNGNASASEVRNLIKEMKNLAHDKYGVEFEEEVEFI